jgi:hypothetical protein
VAGAFVLSAKIRGPHREHAPPGDDGGAVLQRRPHAGCWHPDRRQPALHAARLAHCRICNPGGDYGAVFPDFYRSLPGWTQRFTGSIISMAVVVSVPLNAIFLLGTWNYSQLRLGTDSKPVTAQSFDEFFERQAKDWKVPAEDAARVHSVVDTAIEDAAANANGPVEIQVGSDTFDILVTLRYKGNLPTLPDARPKKEMVEKQSFVSGLAGYLSGLHADRIERSAKGEECEIKLLFRL